MIRLKNEQKLIDFYFVFQVGFFLNFFFIYKILLNLSLINF